MEQNRTKKRNPFVAGLLAFLGISLGHFYVGHFKRGIILIVVLLCLVTAMTIARLVQYNNGFLYYIAALVGFYLFTFVDAVRLSFKEHHYTIKAYNRWYLYVVYYLLVSATQYHIVENRGMYLGYESYRIPSSSMEPTLQVGDFIISDSWADEIERGDIVIFRYPQDPSINYIFRIIALPGESIEYRNKKVFVNGIPIDQTDSGEYHSLATSMTFQQKVESIQNRDYKIIFDDVRQGINGNFNVQEGHYFVMGDNRDNSNDSRYWGFLPAEEIIGKANYVWMNYSPTLGIRKDRSGKKL